MGTNDPINLAISDVIRNCFRDRDIARISTRWDEDSDGDEILNVRIIIADKIADYDARVMASLVRHIRPELAKQKVCAFPLISFMTEAEAGEIAA